VKRNQQGEQKGPFRKKVMGGRGKTKEKGEIERINVRSIGKGVLRCIGTQEKKKAKKKKQKIKRGGEVGHGSKKETIRPACKPADQSPLRRHGLHEGLQKKDWVQPQKARRGSWPKEVEEKTK